MSEQKKNIPVVGIGASAGGIQALERFFKSVSSDSGLAYVVIVHLAKGKKSLLPDLVGKWSDMPVHLIEDGIRLERNHIYVTPPEQIISISDKHLRLADSKKNRATIHPIDIFFRSLAKERRNRAACVILSGTGTDGTLGIKDINANNGFVLVQDPDSAEYSGMPQSAIDTGFADHVLRPKEMPESLISFFSGYKENETEEIPAYIGKEDGEWMAHLFSIIKEKTSHDFSLYKSNTTIRRIHRRMAVNRVDDYDEYLRMLRGSDDEIEALFSEMLIGVTSFFREPKSFEVLKDRVLPDVLPLPQDRNTLRAWVPGCSTGEEAYSIAMVLYEFFRDGNRKIKFQVFGSDIDQKAVETARLGLYPQTIENDVSTERLERFFSREDNHYRVRPNIRESIIFSHQDILTEPPFSNLHLLCCRNLLIYLNNQAQKRIIPMFHFALNDGGILMLGASETIGQNDDLFDTIDTKRKIFRKRKLSDRMRPDFQIPIHPSAGQYDYHPIETAKSSRRAKEKDQFEPAVARYLLANVTPPCLIVDDKENITYIHGDMDRFLSYPSGIPRKKLPDLLRKKIRFEVTSAYRKTRKNKQRVEKRSVRIDVNEKQEKYDLIVRPIKGKDELENHFSITFLRIGEVETLDKKPISDQGQQKQNDLIGRLKNELEETRDNYQSVLQEYETANEESKATNEELQSANEELQSTNEELESSKEELQSLNEELTTVNYELQSKVDELSEKEDDLKNLLQSSPVATIFLDENFNIKRFTPPAGDIYNLIGGDTGRSFFDVSSQLEDGLTKQEIAKVQSDLEPLEKEAKDINDRWYNIKVTPYKTGDNVIQGVIINFSDITRQKEYQHDLKQLSLKRQAALDLSDAIVNSIPESILVLNSELKVLEANQAFFSMFHVSEKNTIRRYIYDLGNGQWNIPELRKLLEEIIPQKEIIEDYTVEHDFPGIGKKTMRLNARRLDYESSDLERILLVIQEENE